LCFIAKLAALVPAPRADPAHSHRVFTRHSLHRARALPQPAVVCMDVRFGAARVISPLVMNFRSWPKAPEVRTTKAASMGSLLICVS